MSAQKSVFIIQTRPPWESIRGQEAQDVMLAASAFVSDLSILFIEEGVYHLVPTESRPGQRNFLATYQAFDLYDIEQRFVGEADLQARSIFHENLSVATEVLTDADIQQRMRQADIVLTY